MTTSSSDEPPITQTKRNARSNVTSIQTKSGTRIIVYGNYRDKKQRIECGNRFVNVYNRNFTEDEQMAIGNILYDRMNRHPDSSERGRDKEWVASTGTFVGKDARSLNPRHKKMVDVQFRGAAEKDESTITHELIHAKMFMVGVKGHRHNERKIDFETVGRVSRHGVVKMRNGYYFSPKGNPHLARKKGMRLTEKGRIAKEGLYADRKLLTGSISNSIIGKTAERKVNRLFPKSFFFKRKF